MLDQIADKIVTTVNDPKFQRGVLNGVGVIATYALGRVVTHYASKLVDIGIDAVMNKLHPELADTTVTE